MSYYDGWDDTKNAIEIKKCLDCGAETDEDGCGLVSYNWSQVLCQAFGDSPCDGFC